MGLYTGGNKKDAPAQYVSPAEKGSLMAQLGQRSGQAIEALGLFLDTPGAIARGILAGGPRLRRSVGISSQFWSCSFLSHV